MDTLVAECQAVRERVGLVDLVSLATIDLTGPDRVGFLHNLITNDVKALREGEGCQWAMLTPQGKALAHGDLFNLGNRLRLSMDRALAPKVLSLLDKYLIMDQVVVTDRSAEVSWLALQGPQAVGLMEQLVPGALPPLAPLAHAEATVAQRPAWIIRFDCTGSDGYAIVATPADASLMKEHILASSETFGLRTIGPEALNTLRVEAGIPWYGVDIDETNLWPETGLEQAVSYTKGCYIGQEIIARIKTYGHVNRCLVRLLLEGETIPQANDPIISSGQTIGMVTSAVFSPTKHQPIALGYVKHGLETPGTKLTIQHGNHSIHGVVLKGDTLLYNAEK